MMPNMVVTPWRQSFADKLNDYQKDGRFHGYTCGNDSRHALLLATVEGWICPDCDYTQNWAHGWEWFD